MRHAPRLALSLASLLLLVAFTRVAHSSDGPFFERDVVAADHDDASDAGAAILAAGGNAADAAAATMLALGVVSPTGSGLGGGGFALYYRASDKSLTFLDFRESAPGKASAEMYRAHEGDDEAKAKQRSRLGGLSVGVPGEPAGIEALVKRFGKLPLSAVVEPAETLARHGFRISAHTVRLLGYVGASLAGNPLIESVFGKTPEPERQAKNIALADTLRRFGKEGKKLFYEGAIAKAMVQRVTREGGVLSLADLARYQVIEREPLRGRAFGHDWVSAPLPSAGGYTILQSLRLLERWLPGEEGWATSARYHALIESWKGPYLDRQRYLGDTDFATVPLTALNADARIEARARRYHPGLALPAERYALPLSSTPPAAVQADNKGTSHLCVVDAEGNVASVTTTVNLPFGSRLDVAGFWLNDEMDDFAREVGKDNAFGLVGGAPNLPAPGKRPLSSMSPTIVLKDGAPVLCAGGSGGSRILTAVEQVALYVLKDGMHPAQALVAPRLHHQADPEEVDVRHVPEALAAELSARGHTLREGRFSASVQAIRIAGPGPKRLAAASDPEKGGRPAGH